MTDRGGVFACIVVRERPPAAVLMGLHRLLGVGASEVRRRIDTGEPLVTEELFGNDGVEVAERLRSVLDLVAPFDHDLHEWNGNGTPAPGNRIDVEVLRNVLAGYKPPASTPLRPAPDRELTGIIADAARAAITSLRAQHPERFSGFALLTDGDAYDVTLSACSTEIGAGGHERWSWGTSPDDGWGHEAYFGGVSRAFDDRGNIAEMYDEDASETEYDTRLASMEEALRLLDAEGLFGTGDTRADTLLLAGALPLGGLDAGCARRLNPAGPLLTEWLSTVAEQPALHADPATTADLAEYQGPLATAPNPTIANLWETTPGLHLPGGITIYGPHALAERNSTHQVAPHASGWVLIGDDGEGHGFLMRAPGPEFIPATGRTAAEVFRLDLEALSPGIPEGGIFVTDDLIGWLERRVGGRVRASSGLW